MINSGITTIYIRSDNLPCLNRKSPHIHYGDFAINDQATPEFIILVSPTQTF